MMQGLFNFATFHN